ncbi:unnamed protein product, partial [Allacma fusca]
RTYYRNDPEANGSIIL